MNEAAAYRQILEDLIRTAQGALELVESPGAMVSCRPEEILTFKRDHPNCTMIIGDFEIHCLDPEKYELEDPAADIDRQKLLLTKVLKSISEEENKVFWNCLRREIGDEPLSPLTMNGDAS